MAKFQNNSKQPRRILLLGIFAIGLFLRLWRLDKFPPGFTPDEAAQGYSAYSILKTGKDEWGVKFPLNLRSFGDFKPPLQTYLMIPSVAALGLNKFAVRFPNAILGSLAIFGVFLLAKEIFDNYLIGLFSAALLAFSPWHQQLSRGAFEANLTVFFISFGVYFLLKNRQVLTALFLGLNMFSYHSAKILTPLITLLFILFISKKRVKKFITHNLCFTTLFLMFLLISFSSFFTGGQKRGLDIAIFHPTDSWQMVKDERWQAVNSGLPDIIARIFHNKITYSLSRFSENYFSYFSPRFLFAEGPGEGTYGMIPGRGVLWWWELPVILFGIYQFIKKPQKNILLIILLVLAAPIPASLTKGVRAANRAAVMMPWIQILTAVSIWKIKNQISKVKMKSQNPKLKKLPLLAQLVYISICLYFYMSFLEDYFVQSPRKIAKPMLYGRCEALREVKNVDVLIHLDRVIVSRKLSEPQAYVMFCLKYPPELAQQETTIWLKYEKENLSFLDQLGEYQLGRFVFREINWASDSKLENTVLVGLPQEFPPGVKFNKVIFYPDSNPAIGIYKTVSNEI